MATTTNDATLSYFTLIGKCEETDDSSYTRTRDGKEETVTKVQLSLVIPGMQDRVRVELPEEVAPSTDLLAQWELEESWVVVSATAMRVISFDRQNARPGEKKAGAFVIYVGANAREATTEERKQLQADAQGAEDPGQAAPCRPRRREGRRQGRGTGKGGHPGGRLAAHPRSILDRQPIDRRATTSDDSPVDAVSRSLNSMQLDRFASKRRRAHIPWWIGSITSCARAPRKVVVLALVANTMVAQLLYNSAGQLVLGNAFVVGYLLISAVCSTFAFALFEVSTIFQLHDLMALDVPASRRRSARRS